jgi:hypothetical protein
MNSKDAKNATEPKRNEPAEKGRNNDPNIRDESAIQPGINTVSTSDYADDNQRLTKTAVDNFREDINSDPNADRIFDEADKK